MASGLTAFLARMAEERLKRRLPDDPPVVLPRSQLLAFQDSLLTVQDGLCAWATTKQVTKAKQALSETRAALAELLR